MQVVLKSRIKEWTENPTTQLVREAIQKELEYVYTQRADYINWLSAEQTQSKRAFLMGVEAALGDLHYLLNGGNLENYFSEDRDYQFINDTGEETNDEESDE